MKPSHIGTRLLAIGMAMAIALAMTACGTATPPGQGTAAATTTAATSAATATAPAAATTPPSNKTAPAAQSGEIGAAAAAADTTLTIEEMMVYAIQDEYLARAEYEVIMDIYGSQAPFTNIIKAEESHIATLKALFGVYGFAIPEDTSANHTIRPDSLEDSYEAGVNAEIVNIDMYERFLKQELPDDIRAAFDELRRGSVNHLAAFEKKAG